MIGCTFIYIYVCTYTLIRKNITTRRDTVKSRLEIGRYLGSRTSEVGTPSKLLTKQRHFFLFYLRVPLFRNRIFAMEVNPFLR